MTSTMRIGLARIRDLIPPSGVLLIGAILHGGALAHAQSGWNWQYPIPKSETLNSVSFIDELNGVAVGIHGAVLQTTDGGVSWRDQNSGTFLDLYGVSMDKGGTGFAVGDSGGIFRTTDGGVRWTSQRGWTDESLRAVACIDPQNALAVGWWGNIYQTSDAGARWSYLPSAGGAKLLGVSFADSLHGFAVGYHHRIARTTDGGMTWMSQELGTTNDILNAVWCIDTLRAVAVGTNGTILRTGDGGITWSAQPSSSRSDLHTVAFCDTGLGVVIGGGKGVLQTTDGGRSWTGLDNISGDAALTSLTCPGKTNFMAVGERGRNVRSTNGGVEWNDLQGLWVSNARSITLDGSDKAVVVMDNGAVLRSTDGGLHWEPNDRVKLAGVSDASFSGDRGVIVRQFTLHSPPIAAGYIDYTTDAGATWSYRQFRTVLYAVALGDSGMAMAVGKMILCTTDDGITWEDRSNAFGTRDVFFSDIYITGNRTAIIVGGGSNLDYTNRFIARTTDLGLTWTKNDTIATDTENLSGIDFADELVGYVVGSRGGILKTTDGGMSWVYVRHSSKIWDGETLSKVSCPDRDHVTVVGGHGRILGSSDGGATWIRQESPTSHDLFDVAFSDPNNGYAVGAIETILHTTSGGVTWTEEPASGPLPAESRLEQNFPNPFNAETTIRYSIVGTASQRVELSVYDILGREVTVLVEETQSPGDYTVRFVARELASGVYLYRLRTGRFSTPSSQTRKLFLIK